MACAMPLGGWLADQAARWSGPNAPALVPKVCMVGSALLLLLGLAARQQAWIVIWFTLSLGMLGLCEASFWTIAVEVGGKKGGTAAAIMNTGGNAVGLLAPMLTPFIASALGWKWGIGLGAMVAVLGALCWFGIKPSPPPAR
jgi:MFS family permease